MVEYLLKSNYANVDDADNCGTTALMDSVRSNSIEIFNLLVKFGAEITRRNKAGFNCLHIAAEVGFTNIILHLVQVYNFDINALTHQGLTAVQIANKVGQNMMISCELWQTCLMSNFFPGEARRCSENLGVVVDGGKSSRNHMIFRLVVDKYLKTV